MFKRAVRYAVFGSFDRANALAPVVGATIVFLAMRLVGIPLASSADLVSAALLLVATLVAAWIVVVIGRFLYWPWRELGELRRSSPLEIFIDPKSSSFWAIGENPHHPPEDEERYGQFFSILIKNHSTEQTIEGIQVVIWHDGDHVPFAAYDTLEKKLTLDPGSSELVKLFFQSYQEIVGTDDGIETRDPVPQAITVRATAKNTVSSPDVRLTYEPTGADIYDDRPIYDVKIRE